MKTQIDLLSALPVRILKPITSTKTVSKADMLADLAFNLDFSGIEVTESVLDSDFLVFKFAGEKVGAIDVRRGRQEFQLPSGEWSTDWDKFMVYLIIEKRAIASRLESAPKTLEDEWEAELDKVAADERKPLTQQEADELVERAVHAGYTVIEIPGTLTDEYALIDEEEGTADIIESHFVNTQQSRLTVRTVTADQAYEWAGDKAQDEYEDDTDQSMTDAQRLLVATHGTIGERILEQLDERFEVEIVENRLEITDTTTNIAVLVEYNREAGTWMGYQSNGQMWAVTGKPSHHLELITKGFI